MTYPFQICLLSVVVAGRILNRFAKDIGFMDELLPSTFTDFNQVSILQLLEVGLFGSFNFWSKFLTNSHCILIL